MTSLLRRVAFDELSLLRRDPIDAKTLATANRIVEDVRLHGEPAPRQHAAACGDLGPGQPVVHDRHGLAAAKSALDPETLAVLTRTAERIRQFAKAQLDAFSGMQ